MTSTEPSTETTIVDVIEEPVPGVVVVTEFEETHTLYSMRLLVHERPVT